MAGQTLWSKQRRLILRGSEAGGDACVMMTGHDQRAGLYYARCSDMVIWWEGFKTTIGARPDPRDQGTPQPQPQPWASRVSFTYDTTSDDQ